MVQTPTESISAFPRPDVVDANGCGIREGSEGMTLRDWFAGHALAGLLASGTYANYGAGFGDYIAVQAGLIADGMMTDRQK